MSIAVQCSSCGAQYRVADTVAGKRVRCTKCGQAIAVPAAAGRSAGNTATATAAAVPPPVVPPAPRAEGQEPRWASLLTAGGQGAATGGAGPDSGPDKKALVLLIAGGVGVVVVVAVVITAVIIGSGHNKGATITPASTDSATAAPADNSAATGGGGGGADSAAARKPAPLMLSAGGSVSQVFDTYKLMLPEGTVPVQTPPSPDRKIKTWNVPSGGDIIVEVCPDSAIPNTPFDRVEYGHSVEDNMKALAQKNGWQLVRDNMDANGLSFDHLGVDDPGTGDTLNSSAVYAAHDGDHWLIITLNARGQATPQNWSRMQLVVRTVTHASAAETAAYAQQELAAEAAAAQAASAAAAPTTPAPAPAPAVAAVATATPSAPAVAPAAPSTPAAAATPTPPAPAAPAVAAKPAKPAVTRAPRAPGSKAPATPAAVVMTDDEAAAAATASLPQLRSDQVTNVIDALHELRRCAASAAVVKAQKSTVEDGVRALMTSDNLTVRELSMEVMALYGGTDSVPQLVPFLNAQESAVCRLEAIRLLAQFKDPRAIGPIADLIGKGAAVPAHLAPYGTAAEDAWLGLLQQNIDDATLDGIGKLAVKFGTKKSLAAFQSIADDAQNPAHATAMDVVGSLQDRLDKQKK